MTAAPALKALIVDDEPVARRRIRALLAEDPDVQVLDECGNGRDAVRLVREGGPDLVFLDIEMPELDGFAVVREIGATRMPMVIFITAHDQYAVDAFRIHAFDYLLKPVERARFHETLARAKSRLREGRPEEIGAQLTRLLEHLAARAPRTERVPLKVEGRVLFLSPEEIEWIEADDDHARVHAGGRTYVVRETLSRFEERLPSGRFMRVHRSSIVNVGRIREIQPWFQGDYVIILSDGSKVTTGRSYRQRLQEFIGRST